MTNLKKTSIFIVLAACGLFGCNQGGTSEEADTDTTSITESVAEDIDNSVTLKLDSTDQLGKFIVDGEGRSLYMFLADSSMTTTCYDACAEAWPPLIAEEKPEAGQGVNGSLIGMIKRRDGQQQVAYNGWPLYYYAEDTGAGQRLGQDLKGFGAEWYLITPEGKETHGEEHQE